MHAAGEETRKNREAAAKLAAEAEAARLVERDRRRGERAARWAAVRGFTATHVVDVLIYGIAVVSFAMAAPAMASYGADVYASALGGLLPLITELGMWAFAVAVLISRVRTPGRPVWGLQAGVWVFGAVACGANAVHGLNRGWGPAVIMGVVSVAGVIAHQLAIASPPRSRTERQRARIERRAAGKAAAAARAAVRTAAAQIDAEGRARLTYTPGTYRVRRGRLVAAPADPDVPGPPDAIDREIAALLENAATGPRPGTTGGGGEPIHRGPVATAEPPAPGEAPDPAPEPGSEPGPDAGDRTAGPAGPDRGPRRSRKRVGPAGTSGNTGSGTPPRRSRDRLWTELQAAVVAGDIDPATASVEEVRKTLRCRKETAKRLHHDLTGND
ncbi:hypothetical protein GCM10022222_42570 [Amycolatopsis ultiminotia]|uniref:DUF2637 domain-containing protein n=1 Tax=Amycolatopsis ultiminotia TaxID=543629 RepID=A0ABP6WPF2_9PSEU